MVNAPQPLVLLVSKESFDAWALLDCQLGPVVWLPVWHCARTDFPRIDMLISWQYDFAQRDPLVHLCIGRSEYQCSKSNSIKSVILFAPQHFSGWVYCYVLLICACIKA
jgi:hypothetical protein